MGQEMNIDGSLIPIPDPDAVPKRILTKEEQEEERLKKKGWKKKRGEWLAPAGPTSAMNQLLRSALGIKSQGKGDHRPVLGPSLPPAMKDRKREDKICEREEKRRKKGGNLKGLTPNRIKRV